MVFDLVVQAISIGGGLSGFASIILHIKRMTGKLRIIPEKGLYITRKSNKNPEKVDSFDIGFPVLFLNAKEDPVSITDIEATMNYKNNKNHCTKRLDETLRFQLIPFDIEPRTSEKPHLGFTFENPPENDVPDNLEVTFQIDANMVRRVIVPLISSDEYDKMRK